MANQNNIALFIRFLIVGGTGFLIDTGITYMLSSFGASPWLARIPAIVLAITYTFMANRKFTYKIHTISTFGESVRYVVVASAMALLNYVIYLIIVINNVWPVLAITIATACQTGLSFYLYRLFVFKK